MRLDHLLSKKRKGRSKGWFAVVLLGGEIAGERKRKRRIKKVEEEKIEIIRELKKIREKKASGGDTIRGNTRSHLEHES